jgi:hypothetical protein
MKKIGLLVLALLSLGAVLVQPYRYYPYGFDEVAVEIPGGVLRIELTDYARTKSRKTYCLSSWFRTSDRSGQPISIAIRRAATASVPNLITNFERSGVTKSVGEDQTSSYFEPGPIGKLVFPTNEAIEIEGTVQYKGISYPFLASLKLRFWAENRGFTSFCA